MARDELDEPDQREERKACEGERSKRLRPSQRAAGGQRAGQRKEHRKHGDHLEAKQRGQEAVRKRIDDDPARALWHRGARAPAEREAQRQKRAKAGKGADAVQEFSGLFTQQHNH